MLQYIHDRIQHVLPSHTQAQVPGTMYQASSQINTSFHTYHHKEIGAEDDYCKNNDEDKPTHHIYATN